ncbi:hypothetical protein SELMODRAFT_431661 [Selaginella moellendorffii]|uniref:Uncharacterized protein n=1 Tax=Selaginella moellendorffii TaxID=88036 RepID=D8TDD4_SELML|nr:hypothetical protein SELMODRAFT_431661 [Selaginella moellendorffii]
MEGEFEKNKGPVAVPMIINPEEFRRLHLETRAHKLNMLYLKDSGSLFLQHDPSLAHEVVRTYWSTKLGMQLEGLGVQTLGNRLVDVCPGGLVEYKDRLQQVDVLVVERSPGQSIIAAQVVLVAQVVYQNEDIAKVVADLDAVTAAENSGARIALAIQVRRGCAPALSVWVKARGRPVENLDPEGVLKLDWNELFEVPEVRNQLTAPGIVYVGTGVGGVLIGTEVAGASKVAALLRTVSNNISPTTSL